mmetsp:Transcript_12676/g.16003  ORF Transcript_12676/g.16003 Transcript_12676/m.16003 type:complete len:281 (+) Transcript_12676:96-938(+)
MKYIRRFIVHAIAAIPCNASSFFDAVWGESSSSEDSENAIIIKSTDTSTNTIYDIQEGDVFLGDMWGLICTVNIFTAEISPPEPRDKKKIYVRGGKVIIEESEDTLIVQSSTKQKDIKLICIISSTGSHIIIETTHGYDGLLNGNGVDMTLTDEDMTIRGSEKEKKSTLHKVATLIDNDTLIIEQSTAVSSQRGPRKWRKRMKLTLTRKLEDCSTDSKLCRSGEVCNNGVCYRVKGRECKNSRYCRQYGDVWKCVSWGDLNIFMESQKYCCNTNLGSCSF